MMRVLPLSLKPVLQQISLFHVEWKLTSDWTPYTWELRHLLQNKFALGCATCTDFLSKSRTTLYFLQQLFATYNKVICCRTGLIRKWWKTQHRYSTFFVSMLQNKLHFLVFRFIVPLLPNSHSCVQFSDFFPWWTPSSSQTTWGRQVSVLSCEVQEVIFY